MLFLKSLFDATFVHMTVGFMSMLVGAFVVLAVSGTVTNKQLNAQKNAQHMNSNAQQHSNAQQQAQAQLRTQ